MVEDGWTLTDIEEPATPMVEDGWTLMRTPCLWYVEEIGDSGGVCKVFFLCKHKLIKSAYLIFKKLCVLFKLYITANFTAAS